MMALVVAGVQFHDQAVRFFVPTIVGRNGVSNHVPDFLEV
jgi:hypothetical protein